MNLPSISLVITSALYTILFVKQFVSSKHSSGFLQLHFMILFLLSVGLALLRTRLLWLDVVHAAIAHLDSVSVEDFV